MPSNGLSKVDSAAFLKILLHTGFLISGTVTVLIGQILPILALRLSLNDAELGYFFITQFSGSLLGTLMTSSLYKVKKIGFIGATSIGYIAIIVGALTLNSENWIICLIAFFILGTGIGLTLPSINMLTVELNSQNATAALNFLNFFWGIGAILCKPFIDFFGRETSILQPTLIIAGALFLIVAITFLLPAGLEPVKEKIEENAKDKEYLPPIWSTSIAWSIALFNFIHVGFESGAGGWITTYASRFPNQSEQISWLSPITLYFLFFIAGRGIAPLYSRFVSENVIILCGLIVMIFGMIVLLWSNSFSLLYIGAAISGFGTAAIFPTNMARFTKMFGSTATRRAAPMFICGTLGSTLITFLIGYVSRNYNDLRVGMFVLLASCVILVVLQALLMIYTKVKS